ncbi:MAG TPA: PEP-utilizing enzyme [Candidatus Nanoarchaeia archaeon]|nr:PEP-utilizing enzyme [Candidatus Nanoarchaeia archaeon]
MKININPREELFKWGPIDMKLVYGSGFIFGVLREIKKYYQWSWPPVFFFIDYQGKGLWVNGYSALREVGLKYFKKYFLNQKNYNNQWEKFEDWLQEYSVVSADLEKNFRRNISKKGLSKDLEKFADFVLRFWLIVHVPEIANWGGEYLLKKELEKIDPARADEYLEILSAPVKYSFFQEEELALLQLAKIKSRAELAEGLKDHAKNWHWILNSYGGNRVLNPEYFSGKLKELLKRDRAENIIKEIKSKISSNQKRKDDLIKKLKLDKKIVFIAEQLSQSIWWQDFRKGYIWRMNHLWDLALRAVERQTSWKFKEMQYCYFDEMAKVLNGKIDKKKVLRRQKHYAFYFDEGKMYEFSDKRTFDKFWHLYAEEKMVRSSEIKGLLVSRGQGGIVRGRARIITNPFEEQNKFKQGEILVAGMTSPEYIVVMKKASAIITNYGGMTCHAAIVSRELGVPCLVNTRNATKIIQTGDLVEVDADRSLVRIIN